MVLFVVDKRRKIGALTLAYFLNLSLGHVPGVLPYLNPDLILEDSEATKLGFDLTLIGMAAFIVGAMVAGILPRRTTSVRARQQTGTPDIFSWLAWRALAIGFVSYFVVLPVSAMLPSMTAVTSALGTLIILGFWLMLYGAVTANDRWRTSRTLAILPVLPLATLVTGGFIGFGTIWAVSVVSFLFVIARRRIWFYLTTPLVIFLGLSLFVTYYQQRDSIRQTIWHEDAGVFERLEKVSTLVTDFQFFDMSNVGHLFALDERLNQNYLVGLGVRRHQEGVVDLLYGGTVPLWALVPRAIWPDKPSVGGGKEVVANFTGIEFVEGTSVGAGQVLEFYMNFGVPGVLTGFAVFGFIFMRLDQGVMRALAMRNFYDLIKLILPGLAMLQPLGNLLEILVATVSAIITSRLIISLKLWKVPRTPRQAKLSGQTAGVIGPG
jgi:hypothetical protein